MRFIFKSTTDDGSVTMELDSVYLPDILEHLTEFLRGAGFVIAHNETLELSSPNEALEIVSSKKEPELLAAPLPDEVWQQRIEKLEQELKEVNRILANLANISK